MIGSKALPNMAAAKRACHTKTIGRDLTDPLCMHIRDMRLNETESTLAKRNSGATMLSRKSGTGMARA